MTIRTGYDRARTPLQRDEHGDAPVRLRGRNDVRGERQKKSAEGRETPVHRYNEHRILHPIIRNRQKNRRDRNGHAGQTTDKAHDFAGFVVYIGI